MSPGQRIRQIREQKDLTQTQLAQRLGRTKQWLSELERGNVRLSYEMAVAVASQFGTTPDAIFLPDQSTSETAAP